MKASILLVVCLAAGMSVAEDCGPDACKHVQKTELNCQGGVILGGGPCGCTDLCSKVEGEVCEMPEGLMASQGNCDLTLHCVHTPGMAPGTGVCRQAKAVDLGYRPHHRFNYKRQLTHARTRCEQMRLHSLISMVVYEGQWHPLCDAMGNFYPQQCDNTHHCFCVDTLTGRVIEGTKVYGVADCSPQTTATPTTTA